MVIVASIALGLTFSGDTPRGEGDLTITASLASVLVLTLNDDAEQSGLLLAHYYEPKLPGLDGADIKETWLVHGPVAIRPSAEGLGVSGMYAWRLPEMPAIAGDDSRDPGPYNVPGVPEQNTGTETVQATPPAPEDALAAR